MELYFLINSLAGGGAEKVALQLAKFLKPKSFFLLEKDLKYKPLLSTCFLSNHSVKTNAIIKSLHIPFYAKKLEKHINDSSAVISFLERANFVNLLTKKKNSKIISVHTYIKRRNKMHPYTFLIKTLYPRADKIVTVSKSLEFELRDFLNLPEEKITTIYNPMEVEKIQFQENEPLNEFEFLKNFPYLITVGRLTKAKGQWYLLRIFKELKKKYKELKLVILGDGELKQYLTELSKNLGLKTYVWNRDKINPNYDVYFLGFQENPFKFVKHSKVFVFTSLWEGFGNVLIETLAVGKTIVSTDCRTGPREILAPNTDFLYQTTKPELAEYGILMPTFERKLLKANDPLTDTEKIWIETLNEVLKNEKLLKKYEQKAPIRAQEFHIKRIVPYWESLIGKFS